MNPMLDSKLLLGNILRDAAGRASNHCLVRRRKRPCLVGETFDGWIAAVRGHQSRQRLDQVPRGAIDPGLVAGMNIRSRPSPPPLGARDQLKLDDALGAKIDADFAVESLCSKRHEDAATSFERSLDFGPAHYLGKMRRADLFFALGNEHEVHGQLAAGPTNRMKRSEESSFAS